VLGHQEGNDENRFHGSSIEALVLQMTTLTTKITIRAKCSHMMQPHPVAVLGCQVVQTLRQVQTPVSWPTLIRPRSDSLC
jgi:hypothetical protein